MASVIEEENAAVVQPRFCEIETTRFMYGVDLFAADQCTCC